VVDASLLRRCVLDGVPSGRLFALDVSGQGKEISDPAELGDRVRMVYARA